MGNAMRSLDDALAAANSYGMCRRAFFTQKASASTAANVTSGYVTLGRHTPSFTVPTLTTATGYYMVGGSISHSQTVADVSYMLCLEVLLGTLTVSGNSYVDGSAMPTSREDPGDRTATLSTASMFCLAVVSTIMTATTPVLTVNYTNQSGTTGRSGTMTLPTNCNPDSAFMFNPHMQSGDTGVRDLSASGPNGMSISTGTAGSIKMYGCIPLLYSAGPLTIAGVNASLNALSAHLPQFRLVGGDVLSVYDVGQASNNAAFTTVQMLPDN